MTNTPEPEQADLAYKADGSDKVYHVFLQPQDGGWMVRVAYGRRGGTLRTEAKTAEPVDHAQAKKIFDKTVKAKRAGGYSPGGSGTPFEGTEKAGRVTGLAPQLLNPVEDLEALLQDDEFWAQEKHDGNRVMVQKAGGDVTGVNKLGLSIALPESLVAAVRKIPGDAVLDGELVGEAYFAFDAVQPGPYSQRLDRVVELASVAGAPVHAVQTFRGTRQKRQLLKEVTERDGEGIVFKLHSAPYEPGRPNSGGAQQKHKLTESATVVVLGRNGAKRSVRIGVLDGGAMREIGSVTIPANHEIPDDDAIAEVGYLYAYPGGALAQPTFKGLRSDATLEACTADQLKLKPAVGRHAAPGREA